MRNQSNNFLLDGASNNDSFNTGFVLRPPPDAIQEFKILTHSYDAEYGRNAGSIVNVVTKAGSNDWHGGAWEFNRDDALQAKNCLRDDETGAEAEPVRRRGRRPDREEPAVHVQLLRRVQEQAGHHRHAHGAVGRRSATAISRAARRFAIRSPGSRFPATSFRPDRISPISRSDSRPVHSAARTRRSTASTRSPNVEDTPRAVRHAVRLPAEQTSTACSAATSSATPNNVNPLGGSNFSPAGNTAIATLQDVMGSDTWMVKPNMINVARAVDEPHHARSRR